MEVAGLASTTMAAVVVTPGPAANADPRTPRDGRPRSNDRRSGGRQTPLPGGPAATADPGAFIPLAEAQVWLTMWSSRFPLVRLGHSQTLTVRAPILTPDFVAAWSRETPVDPFSGPIFQGATATVCGPVDCHCRPVMDATSRPAAGTCIIPCGMLYRRRQGKLDRLCVPDGGLLRTQLLQECHYTHT